MAQQSAKEVVRGVLSATVAFGTEVLNQCWSKMMNLCGINHPNLVIMLGTALDTKGGVSSVERELLSELNGTYSIFHLSTHQDGTRIAKFRRAAVAYFCLLGFLLVDQRKLFHVHFSAGISFWRKSVFITTVSIFGGTVIGHAHGGEFAQFYKKGYSFRRKVIQNVLKQFKYLIVLSPQWRDFYSQLLPPERIRVIPNFVTMPVDPVRAPPSSKVILSLGRLGRGKGTYDLLEACISVFAIFPDAELWLGGDGDLEAVRNLVIARNWQSRVRLLGWITREKRLTAFQAAQVFALPSYDEALPMALLEAMAYGLPPVTTPVGGIPWVVEDNRTGLLVQPADTVALARALVRLLQDGDLRSRIGTAARREIASRFATDVIVPKVKAVYSEGLGM